MATTIYVPELGDDIDSVDVVSVLVEAGNTVKAGQALVEVETEKAAVEIPSTLDGTVTQIHVAKGDSLKSGDALISLDAVSEETTSSRTTSAEVEQPSPPPEAPAPPQPEEDVPTPEPATEPLPATSPRTPSKLIAASPRVRRLAREIGVDISAVKGTGKGGRMTMDDVKAHANRLLSHGGPTAIVHQQTKLPDFSRWGEIEEVPASKIRQVTARRMHQAWTTVPQVTNHDDADITRLEAARKSYRNRVADAGGKLTLTAILVKVTATALKAFPNLNSSFDPAQKLIIRKHYVHIGVAVDTDAGLLVPVIRDAADKSITTIAIELEDLADRARRRKLKPDEMEGATFTISNLGGIGGTGFSPIVNWPEVAILGVSRGAMKPVWNGVDFEPRLIMPLSLSYDHRLVDGAQAARFLRWLVEAIEEPLMISM